MMDVHVKERRESCVVPTGLSRSASIARLQRYAYRFASLASHDICRVICSASLHGHSQKCWLMGTEPCSDFLLSPSKGKALINTGDDPWTLAQSPQYSSSTLVLPAPVRDHCTVVSKLWGKTEVAFHFF